MNLAPLDWLIVAALLCAMLALAVAMKRHTRGVTAFLSADRCAGRYLLTLSEGLTSVGLVGVIANFEKFYHAGFAASWWGQMMAPIGMVIALAGWVNYRYRETRCLTMAEFFERRYSRKFRVFAGILGWFSGVLNYGVFPGVVARFLVYFCGFPPTLHVFGLAVPTIAPLMAFLLGVTLVLTLTGGMVTVMITDFLQAQFVNIVFLVIAGALCLRFTWPQIAHVLVTTAPAGKSMVNPFDQGGVTDFNVWFFGIFAFKLFYNRLGWQGTQGFNSAPKSPHEGKMAGILAEWRGGVTYLVLSLMPICAYVLLHAANSGAAAATQATIASVHDKYIQSQITTPVAMVHVLPVGVVGLLCAAMLAGTIGNDTTYLHSWGSIFIQDVYLPLSRKESVTTTEHLRLLRWSIFGVAGFAWLFSLLFPLRDFILMYFLVTGAIYLGGSGAAIIGGLYWSRGTTKGAWWGMGVGSFIATSGAILTAAWPSVPALAARAPAFPLNGAWMTLISASSASVVYVLVSLATCRKPFDMNWLLHRNLTPQPPLPSEERAAGRGGWGVRPRKTGLAARSLRRLGITEEFTTGDKAIYLFKIAWTMFWFVAFVIGTVLGLAGRTTTAGWLNWWEFTVVLGLVVGAITVVWFLWGGLHDLGDLLRALKARAVSDAASVETPPVGEREAYEGIAASAAGEGREAAA